MKKYNFLRKLFFVSAILLMIGCEEENKYQLGAIVAPTNLQIYAEIVGQDETNPNGDGSGVVHYTATADNAIGFKFFANGQEFLVPGGEKTISFSTTGLHDYQVSVAAIGTGGTISSASVETTVLVLYAPPAELLAKLHGDSSRTWRIKAESGGHFGLGPPDGLNGPEWYAAGANEKSTVGMYDDRYVFNADGTFQHQTGGTVFGREVLIDELGSTGGTQDGADILNLPLDDYSGLWTLSAPGGVETISLSGTGFIGYYIGGNHQYKIANRANPNEMTIYSTDGNNQFNWWFIITSE